jgi:hypothetical protein
MDMQRVHTYGLPPECRHMEHYCPCLGIMGCYIQFYIQRSYTWGFLRMDRSGR